jgi:two-component system, NarL family, sensor kinase
MGNTTIWVFFQHLICERLQKKTSGGFLPNFPRGEVAFFSDFYGMKRSLTALFVVLPMILHAQMRKLDSIENLLPKAATEIERIRLLNDLSLAYRTVDFKKSLEFALQAKARAKNSGNQTLLAQSILHAGIAYYYQGNHELALESYFESLKIYEKINDTRGTAAVLNEVGTLEKKNGDLKNSEEHLLKALDLSHAVNDSALIANSMNNLGHVYELKEDFTRAMDYYSTSAVIKEILGDLYGASFNYDNMGNILAKQGKYDDAKKFFEKEIDIFEKLNDKAAYAVGLNNMGEMYNFKGDYPKSREYLMKSLAVSTEIGYKDLRSHIYNVLSDTYRKENNYRKAYDYVMLGTALKDSIFNEQKSKQLLDMRTKYETEKKESEILVLKQENDLKDFGLRQNRLFNLGLILVVLGLLIVGYLWQNRTKLKQRAELEATRAALRESQLQAVILSQEEERKRFAEDLHDGLGQIISALRLSLSKENPEKQILDHALSLLNDMNIEIRNIAFNLMPQSLMKDGLEEALIEFSKRLNRSGPIQITVKAFHVNKDMPADQKVPLYRVCQEWVNNVIKYSHCNKISIQLVQHQEELVLTIEDDGDGFDTSTLFLGQGNGWKNINSRIGLLKGILEIDSMPGRTGTTVVISVPTYTLVS